MTTENADAVPQRRFFITVQKPWKLWIWPFLALAYFTAVMLIVIVPIETGIPHEVWVVGGLGLFVFLVIVQLLLLPTRKVRVKKAKKAKKDKRAAAAAAAPAPAVERVEVDADEAFAGFPDEFAAPPAPTVDVDLVLTSEDHKGRRVLEVSLPGKSRHRGAVYAKAYVAVDASFVLRIEDLVAERHEFG